MKKILVISPHPDDEVLGCGGTLLLHKKNKDTLSWLIVTQMDEKYGWTKKEIKNRDIEIKKINKFFGFKKTFQLPFISSQLSSNDIQNLIKTISKSLNSFKPEVIYLPYINDAHTDHQIIAKAFSSCIKRFRYPSIKKVLMYETLSETNLNFISKHKFNPNYFVNINRFIDKKIKAMKIYKSEINKHPFPRSVESIKSLAILRGSQVNLKYAESFEIIYDIIDK